MGALYAYLPPRTVVDGEMVSEGPRAATDRAHGRADAALVQAGPLQPLGQFGEGDLSLGRGQWRAEAVVDAVAEA
ncbi:hypothetical protein GCM10023317_72250 [Actinopolymorpha pittospori]